MLTALLSNRLHNGTVTVETAIGGFEVSRFQPRSGGSA
jgi:hypothetical protein